MGVEPFEDRDPDGVGVCLSGGGIRAASFALGVSQSLQAELGLFYGEGCADVLAAVSGGAYTAAASTLQAHHMAVVGAASDQKAPLAEGTPESNWILTHGQYLKGGG